MAVLARRWNNLHALNQNYLARSPSTKPSFCTSSNISPATFLGKIKTSVLSFDRIRLSANRIDIMTDSSTTRLDRLEALAETMMLGIERNSRLIEQNSRLIEQNSRDIKESMVEVVDMLATLGQQIEANSQRIEENSIYIRGLQAENRNILSLLMEQLKNDDGNNGDE